MKRLRLPFGLRARSALAVPALTLVFLSAGLSAAEAQRLALVVGNSDYSGVSPLKNASRDARDVADSLTRLGFEVTLLTDVQTADFWDRVDAFSKAAETAESAVFFYSGHAFQMNGANYLVPVDAKLSSRDAIRDETWNLDGIIARLQDRKRQTLIFLDACRNDPLPQAVRGSGAADGLARLQTGVGTFVAFATEPGAVTYDGAGDAPNSPFTTALLEHIETPGISVSDMMIRVRNEVEERTLRRQTPWDQSSLREQFYFKPSVETRQELSEADFELLAQLPTEDRRKFLDLLRASGFSEESLRAADVAIEVASLNLEIAASDGGVSIGSGEGEASASSSEVTLTDSAGTEIAAAPAPEPEPEFEFEIVEGGVTIGDAPAAPDAPFALAEADPAPAGEPAATGELAVAALDPAVTPPSAPDSGASAPSNRVGAIEDTPIDLLPQPDVTLAMANPDEQPPIRLAALTWETRGIIGINALTVDRLRVAGNEVTPDNEANRDLLARIDPRLLNPAEEQAAQSPADARELARMAQTELRRLGCYHMGIDGAWGPGSRTALTSYYLAKRSVPDTLEPTDELIEALKGETKVVCEVRVAKAVVKGKTKAILPVKAEVRDTRRVNKQTGRVVVTQTERKSNIKKGLLNPGSF
ncbi:caspase family protein [Szabonella alba]|uniref:Caspase family protein n=1 Tax=Szabonella alba TaxID=2804194 RepID=A0A8K0Y1A4_9RHOB|nr:caspase family protein [Szabonella alba]MBL4917943.1 caspase family protein [Szabonella alba]